jgi:signal transduction histidine kinase/HPt (histidine-containing phosphotransfer) domain-containing protein
MNKVMRKKTILIVDDQNENILLLNNLLKTEYKTLFARDGKKAIHIACSKCPDLILLDIQMPEMDGYEICKILKENTTTSDIPVIFVTAMSEEIDETKGFEIGAVDYVTKPISPMTLMARVSTHIKLREAIQEAINANQAKSDFLASMSHEIRTPMNAILGMTELSLQQSLNDDLQENLFTIRDSANHLLDIINDLLDISKIEAGKITLEKIDFDLFYAINAILRTFKVHVSSKNLTLNFENDENTPRYVKGDSLRLKQILVNLLGNAIKFTQEGSINVHVSGNETNNNQLEFTFSVTDTGIGIPEDKLNTIFENFSQADLSTTRKYGGTGLGLSISKKLVELMGGSIHVESKLDEGSRFYFNVVLEKGDEQAVQKQLSIEKYQKKVDLTELNQKSIQHILVIDDNHSNLKVAEKFLNKYGYKPYLEPDVEKAFEVMNRIRFDVILMDIEMPEMDGLEATRKIRNGEVGNQNIHVPIIAMTAHALSSHRQKCFEAGMNDYITKPVNFNELKITIDRVLKLTANEYDSSCEQKKIQNKEKQIINSKQAIARLEGDKALYNLLLQNFKKEYETRMENIKKCIESKDLKKIILHSHSFKSESEIIGAEFLSSICKEIESDANNNLFENMHYLYQQLTKEGEIVFKKISQKI